MDYYLPETKDIHVFPNHEKNIVLDVHKNVVFKTDPDFGAFLQRKGLRGDSRESNFIGRLTALRQTGLFGENASERQPYTNPIYKLSLEAFHGCNLNCLYCYGKAGGNYHNSGLRPDFLKLKEIIDFFVEDFGKEAKSYEINVVGAGEPLLNFNLVKDLQAYCRAVGKRVGKPVVFWVFTNGTVFNEEIVDYFIQEKQGLTISLDGPPEIHDVLRPFPNGQGSYATIKQWIGQILEKSKGKGGLEYFWVSTVVTAKHQSIKDIVTHLYELGVRNAQIRPIKTMNEGLTLTQDSMEQLLAQYDELVSYLISKVTAGDLEEVKIILNDRDFWGRHVIRALHGEKINYRCGAAKSKICVLANGDIYPCDISADLHGLKLGNINTGLIPEKVNHFYDQEVSQKETCRDCWCRYYCGGGCYVAAFVHNGVINDPDRVKCELIKRLVELAIIFISELQAKSPENFQKLCRYVDIQEKIINRIYGLV